LQAPHPAACFRSAPNIGTQLVVTGLPNSDLAVVEEYKITHYLLSSGHPAGRGKAAFFRRFGFSTAAWEKLRDALLDHGRAASILDVEDTPFGNEVHFGRSLVVARRPQSANSDNLVHHWGDKADVGYGLRRIGS
jgi:hypothetical protein